MWAPRIEINTSSIGHFSIVTEKLLQEELPHNPNFNDPEKESF